MAATSINLDELSDILECAVCLDTVQNPKTLVCNHSYCKRCLDGLLRFELNGTAVINCPKSCKEVTRISCNQTTNDIGVDYMLKRIASIVNAKDNVSAATASAKKICKCETGTDCDRNASNYCIACDEPMCEQCSAKHNKCQKKMPLLSIGTDNKNDSLVVVCKKHGTHAPFVCCNNELVCLYCLNRNHMGHQYESLESTAQNIRDILDKESEQMEMFYESINEKILDTENEIAAAKENLENLLKRRKMKCVSDYVDFVCREEKRILDEFTLITSNHIEDFLIPDPKESFKKYLTKEDVRIVLQKPLILSSLKSFEVGKIKKIKEVNITLSRKGFYNRHPLGSLKVTHDRIVPLTEAEGTFKHKFSSEGIENLSEKLLKDMTHLYKEALAYNLTKQNNKSNEPSLFQDTLENISHQESSLEMASASRLENCRVSRTEEYNIVAACDVSEDDVIGLGGSDASGYNGRRDSEVDTDQALEYLRKYEEGKMNYIEDLIENGKNNELVILLQERPEIFYLSSEISPFHNQPIHMAAKYNNIGFLKELLRHDKSMIDFKNNLGANPFHASACYSSAFDCFKWLTDTYSPNMLERKNKKGQTPLHIAASRNVIEAVKLLLEKGVDVWIEDNEGNTPLDLAKRYDFAEIIDILNEAMQEIYDEW